MKANTKLRINNFCYTLAFILLASVQHSHGQAGANDPSFNPSDVGFNAGLGITSGTVYSSAVQSDGKVIISGDFTNFNNTNPINRIARLDSNTGLLDPTFLSGTGANAIVEHIYVQPDGKILVAGVFTTYNGVAINGRHLRLNSDGTRDVTYVPSGSPNGNVYSVISQADGKVIIAGSFSAFNGIPTGRIVRLNSDGTTDGTFVASTGADGTINSVGIQSDGKIIIAGAFTTYDGTPRSQVARLNSDGTLDNTFDIGTGASTGFTNTLAIQSDDKVILGGAFTIFNGTTVNRIVRLNTDGSVDGTFATGTGVPSVSVQSISIQSDGKIIVAGSHASFNGTTTNDITRLNSDGTIDTSFDSGDGVGSAGVIYTTSVDPTGRVIIGGDFGTYDSLYRGKVARLETNGAVDNTFNPVMGTHTAINDVELQPDGKILLAGDFITFNDSLANRIVRLEPDGSIDETFAIGTGADNRVTRIKALSDGKIMLGGIFDNFNGSSKLGILRLNIDGTLDNTFTGQINVGNDVNCIIEQPDGKIVVGGNFTQVNGGAGNGIARFNSDGTKDSGFIFGSGFSSVSDVEDIQLLPNGKLVVVGGFTFYNGTASNRIIRLNSDGTVDGTFTPGSGASGGNVECIALQADGKLLIGGAFTTYNGTAINRIARLNENGSLDNTFSVGSGFNGTVTKISVTPAEKIIVSGSYSNYNGIGIRLVRLNSDGSIDNSFQSGSGPNTLVNDHILTGDSLLIVGNFTSYDGIGRNRIARIFATQAPPPTVITSDSLALVALYNATNGPGWTNSTNWLTGPVNTWFGVTVSGGRVTELDLSINQLAGVIPVEIGNLTNLTDLYLYENQLSGAIPAELGNLSNLTVLSLDFNQLTGSIPTLLGNLTNLTLLDLSDNLLTGAIPAELGNLSNLVNLDLSLNQLSGTLPIELGNLSILNGLYLENNQLAGVIPAEIGNLANLTDLYLFENQLSGAIPAEIGNLTNLTELHIHSNQLTGIPNLSGLTSLTLLVANNNFLTFEDIEPNIGITGFTYAPQKNIAALPSQSIVVGEPLDLTYVVGGAGNQYQWYKDGAVVSGATTNSFTKTFAAADVGHYYLQITNPSAPLLTLLTDSTFVDVNLNVVSVSDSLALVALYNATNGPGWTNKANWLTGNVSTWFGVTVSGGRVTELALSSNQLSGTLPSEIGDITALTSLILNVNQLNGSIPAEIGNLTALSVLAIASAQLEGNVPSEIGNLSGLTILNFSSNQLVGSIPAEFINLEQLTNLILTNNQLTNVNEVRNLTGLTSLSLGINQLVSLPDLSSLAMLTQLNVANNNLTFDDIEPNIGITGFTYFPQNSTVIDSPVDSLVQANTNYTIQISDTAPSNVYTWTKDGLAQPTLTTGTFNFTPISRETVGDYQCVITNPVVPDLTFTYTNRVRAFAGISGQVKISEAEGATKGSATLLKITGTGAYDTTYVEQLTATGTFAFDTVLLDDYLFFAEADTVEHVRALPTYFGNTIFWEEADTLFVNENRDDLIVNTVFKPSAPPSGTGELFGFFQEDDGLGNRVEKTRRVGGAGVSARRAQSAGRGQEDLELIAYTVTDEEGNFSLPNLPTGDYRLNIQYPGYPMDESSFVRFSIDNNPLEQSIQVEATVLNGKIVVRQLLITELELNEKYTVRAFPNPAREKVTLFFDAVVGNRKVRVVDTLGKSYFILEASQKQCTINTQSFTKGLYFLKIYEGNEAKKTLRLLIE